MTVRLWDFEECRLVATCRGGHHGQVSCIEPLVPYGCFVSMDITGAICLWSAVNGPNVHVGGLIYTWMNAAPSETPAASGTDTFLTGMRSTDGDAPPRSIVCSSIAANSSGSFVLVRARLRVV